MNKLSFEIEKGEECGSRGLKLGYYEIEGGDKSTLCTNFQANFWS
jgi:hypothetical protein